MSHLFQINTSPGGLPKLPKQQAFISQHDVEGDAHNWKGHGGPNAAVCLYSLECILALQKEGNLIFPGALGENFTLSGVNWQVMQPGLHIQIGKKVLLEVTSFATPCIKIEPYLNDIMRVSQKKHPGWGRPYCKVLRTGSVKIGDVVTLL